MKLISRLSTMNIEFLPRHIATIFLCSLSLSRIVYAQPQISLGPAFDSGSAVVTDIQHAPGDPSKLFVATRDGRIRILTDFTGTQGTYAATDFMNIATAVESQCLYSECG